jgi:hypothetical protein
MRRPKPQRGSASSEIANAPAGSARLSAQAPKRFAKCSWTDTVGAGAGAAGSVGARPQNGPLHGRGSGVVGELRDMSAVLLPVVNDVGGGDFARTAPSSVE